MSLRNFGSGRRRMMSKMKVVPYIDVMLVLVVILMVAAPFVNPSVVNLPSVAKASKSPDVAIQVVVYADGKLAVKEGKNLQPTDLPQLVATVQGSKNGLQTPVVIAADRSVQYERVVDVMKQLQRANVERIGLSLQIDGKK